MIINMAHNLKQFVNGLNNLTQTIEDICKENNIELSKNDKFNLISLSSHPKYAMVQFKNKLLKYESEFKNRNETFFINEISDKVSSDILSLFKNIWLKLNINDKEYIFSMFEFLCYHVKMHN